MTFARLKDTQKIAAITTSPKELLHRPLRSLVTNVYPSLILEGEDYDLKVSVNTASAEPLRDAAEAGWAGHG